MATRCYSRKLYSTVCQILEDNPITRSSDRELILSVYKEMGIDTTLPYETILRLAPPSESITRARRKAQENHPSLLGTDDVENQRWLNEQEYKQWSQTY